MNTMKKIFAILIATLFLGVVSIGENWAGDKGKDPKPDSIKLDSSRSNKVKGDKPKSVKSDREKQKGTSKDNTTEQKWKTRLHK